MSQLLWACITYPTLSTFPVGGNQSTRRKPTTFGRALTIYSFYIRTGFESTLLGIELETLEVKCEWSDHYTAEAPFRYSLCENKRVGWENGVKTVCDIYIVVAPKHGIRPVFKMPNHAMFFSLTRPLPLNHIRSQFETSFLRRHAVRCGEFDV